MYMIVIDLCIPNITVVKVIILNAALDVDIHNGYVGHIHILYVRCVLFGMEHYITSMITIILC